MHYYQFNIGDWALEAGHLSLEEEAVYLRLINHYLNTEQPIPSETQWVIRRLRIETQSVIDHVLAEFFELTDKGWVHNKCEEMLKAYRKTVKKNRANGAKGGRPRKHLGSSETQSEPTGNPLATQTKPTGNPNQEPLTKNHKPVNQVKESVSRKRFIPPTNEEAGVYFVSKGSSQQDADRFIDHHAARDWIMTNRLKMKNWKAAARTWMSNDFSGSTVQKLPAAQEFKSGGF